ncbi:RPA-interacting protein [Eublepharis macularius]|uniref:RPA-interacting protein n=1 Tax=Eublepharis macularius TaxID=481883 RepID=A0AA97KKE2_EUBMA|nr:RPA-interacting protein [Eublepharis macularius]
MAGSMESLVQQRRCLYKSCRAPPWKETYRQRCVERLKNSRARLLDRYRHMGENAAASGGTRSSLLVQEVMEVEWQALQSEDVKLLSLRKKDSFLHVLQDSDELAVLEEIQKELILQEQLAIEEYEQSLRFDEECLNAMLDGLDADRKVICPVCRRNNLAVMSHVITCTCGLCVGTQGMTEDKLRSLLGDEVTEHSQYCQHSPEFAVTNGMDGETSLLMSCQVCDFLAVIL